MLRRSASAISLLSSSGVVLGWCRGAGRRKRRRKGGIIRLGKRRRGFCLGLRPVVRWGVVASSPFRVLKKIVIQMAASGRLMEAYCWSLAFLRPNLFPLC
ncbi:hypothetical protein PHJA_001260600 [Phtheirospermum japonicum]|uniref:Secreted protein n=1 Tax=Phtheirospermum japonicum TaxID=374723 RepID=A0A830BWN3_9LAMI|nr:hypothetical protein PHJA_001260600 [Phtheirospermum japonicum]